MKSLTRSLPAVLAVAILALTPALARADHKDKDKDRDDDDKASFWKQKNKENPFRKISIEGTTASGPVKGKLDILGFYAQDGQVWATGILTGTLNGEPFSTSARAIVTKAPGAGSGTEGLIQQQAVVCNILTLNLGALHLDLLGLVVNLAPVNLVIDAVTGAGNLLGNLLCAIVGLFDAISLGGLISNLLNQLIALLNALLAGLSL